MDNESFIVTFSTALGGLLGWVIGRIRIYEACRLELEGVVYNLCVGGEDVGAGEARLYLAELNSLLSSTIFSGLVFGLVSGVVIVGVLRTVGLKKKNPSQTSEDQTPADVDASARIHEELG